MPQSSETSTTTRPAENARVREAGFTLVELMTVVLVISILLSIAIPTFVGARKRAQGSLAKASVRTALSKANVLFNENTSYRQISQTSLSVSDPTLSFTVATNVASTDPKTVSWMSSSSGDDFYAAAYATSGICFYARIVGGVANYATATGSGNCSAFYAQTNGGVLSFSPSWTA